MLTPLQRGLLVIIFGLVAVLMIIWQSLCGIRLEKRAYTYLFLMSIMFPLIDLGIERGGFRLSIFNVATTAYLLFNWKILKLLKKYYLVVWLLVAHIITSLFSEFAMSSLLSIPDKMKGFVVLFAVLVAGQNIGGNKDKYRLFFRLFKWPLFFTLLWGIVQLLIDPFFTLFYSVWHKEVRISSCFVDPQICGCAVAILAIYEWLRYIRCRNIQHLLFFALLMIIGMFTGSKSFLIGVVAGLIVSLFFIKWKSQTIFLFVLAGLGVILTYDQWIMLPVFERLRDMDSSLEGRGELYWSVALLIFMANWLTGIGCGNFQQYIEKYNYPLMHHTEDGDFIYANQPESGYLLWLDEMGVFSVFWLMVLIYILRKRGDMQFNVSLLVPWMICFVSLYNLQSNMLIYLLFLVAGSIMFMSEKSLRIKSL